MFLYEMLHRLWCWMNLLLDVAINCCLDRTPHIRTHLATCVPESLRNWLAEQKHRVLPPFSQNVLVTVTKWLHILLCCEDHLKHIDMFKTNDFVFTAPFLHSLKLDSC